MDNLLVYNSLHQLRINHIAIVSPAYLSLFTLHSISNNGVVLNLGVRGGWMGMIWKMGGLGLEVDGWGLG